MAHATAGALALEGDLEQIAALLEAQGDGAVHIMDEDGRTMLHWAASGGHAAVVGLLLEKGALANALDESGWSALHIAVSGGRTEIVDALLSAGADPFAINGSGQLALHYAASRDRRDAARLLLSAAGERAAAMASFPDRAQNTPLHRAAAQGLAEMVSVLLEAGALPESVDRDGATALHLAVIEQQRDVARLLLDAGGPPLLAVKTSEGETAPEIAAAKAKQLYGMGEAHAVAVELAEMLGAAPDADGGGGGS